MQQLDPRAKWLFFINSLIASLFLFTFLGMFGMPLLIASTLGNLTALIPILLCCVLFVLSVGLAYFWAELTYQNWKFELAEEGFKKESGVIFKKYVTIPYDRIQNVDIYRGLFSRMIGLSDLQVQTAGFSYAGQYGGGAEGRLPGLSAERAEEIRSELIKRAKRK